MWGVATTYSDSISSPSFYAGSELQGFIKEGYTVHDTAYVARQSDGVNCTMFCLRDARTLADADFRDAYAGAARSGIALKADKEGQYLVSTILPSELLVATQSMSKLKSHQEIGAFIEEIAQLKKTGQFEAQYGSKSVEQLFEDKFLSKVTGELEALEKEIKDSEFAIRTSKGTSEEIDTLKAKFKKTKNKRDSLSNKKDFVTAYSQSLNKLIESEEYRSLYFYRSEISDTGVVTQKTVNTSVTELSGSSGVNVLAATMRSRFLEQMLLAK